MFDPFKTLEVPAQFDLNEVELHTKFIQASSLHHPDRHTDPVKQAEAAEKSAAVNQAYAILSDPERRADALLKQLGGPAKEDDKSLPPALLMEMMEVRETMEEAIADNNKTELDKLRSWAHDQKHEHLSKIAQLFDKVENTLSDADAKAIRLELNALRYIQRMLEQMP